MLTQIEKDYLFGLLHNVGMDIEETIRTKKMTDSGRQLTEKDIKILLEERSIVYKLQHKMVG